MSIVEQKLKRSEGISDYCLSIDFDHEAVMRKELCVVATKMEDGMFEYPFVD